MMAGEVEVSVQLQLKNPVLSHVMSGRFDAVLVSHSVADKLSGHIKQQEMTVGRLWTFWLILSLLLVVCGPSLML